MTKHEVQKIGFNSITTVGEKQSLTPSPKFLPLLAAEGTLWVWKYHLDALSVIQR